MYKLLIAFSVLILYLSSTDAYSANSPSKLSKRILYRTIPGELAEHRDDIIEAAQAKFPKKSKPAPVNEESQPETISKYKQMKEAHRKKRERERKHGMKAKGKSPAKHRRANKEHNRTGHRP